MTAHLTFDSEEPGHVQVSVHLTNLMNTSSKLKFLLPKELTRLNQWTVNRGRAELEGNRVKYAEGPILDFPTFTIRPDSDGKFSATYEAAFGRPLATLNDGRFGPLYGFADTSQIALPLDQVLPLIAEGERLSKVSLHIDPGGYRLYRTSPSFTFQPRPDRTYRKIIFAGNYNQTQIALPAGPITVATQAELDGIFVQTATALLRPISDVFGGCASSPVLVGVNETSGAGLAPLWAPGRSGVDLRPFTPERALRAAKTVAHMMLSECWSSGTRLTSGEYWLAYALPIYYAIEATSSLGYLNEDVFVHDILNRYNHDAYSTSLETVGDLPPTTRELIATEQGYLALRSLDATLAERGLFLSDVVRRYAERSDWLPLSFLNTLRLHLGYSEASRWWSDYVRTERPQFSSETPALRLRPVDPKPTGEITSVVLTTSLFGNLELCGCKLNQAGGAARRASFIAEHRAPRGIVIDLGNFLHEPRSMSPDAVRRMENRLQLDLMTSTDYTAMGLGFAEFAQLLGARRGTLPTPLISANVPEVPSWMPASILGRPTAIVMWSDTPPITKYHNHVWLAAQQYDITFESKDLQETLKSIPEKYQDIILGGYIHPKSIQMLTNSTGRLSAILSSYDGYADNAFRYGYIGRTFVAFWPGDKGASVAEMTISAKDRRLCFHDVSVTPMTEEIEEVPAVASMVDRLFNSREFLIAVSAEADGMPIDENGGSAFEAAPKGARYVGSLKCKACHEDEFAQWRTTSHATAIKTLLDRRRNYHPGCVSCHVTGFGQPGGYSMSGRPAHLESVGCESCHGPGSDHVLLPNGENIVGMVSKDTCGSCHTVEHSTFDESPESYIRQVRHAVSELAVSAVE